MLDERIEKTESPTKGGRGKGKKNERKEREKRFLKQTFAVYETERGR